MSIETHVVFTSSFPFSVLIPIHHVSVNFAGIQICVCYGQHPLWTDCMEWHHAPRPFTHVTAIIYEYEHWLECEHLSIRWKYFGVTAHHKDWYEDTLCLLHI